MSAIRDHVMSMPLVDHHCHGITLADLDRNSFELLSTESSSLHYRSHLDAPFGLVVRSECAPLLGLPRHSSIDDYLVRRAELGPLTVAKRLLAATGISTMLIDTGHLGQAFTTPDQLAELSGADAFVIARLEAIAESAIMGTSATDAPRTLADAVNDAAGSHIGFKSIIAYRYGLDFDPARPSDAEVTAAAGAWIAQGERTSNWRLDDPLIMRYLLHLAVDTGLPLQFHIGFGDSDAVQHRCNPSHLSNFLADIGPSGCNVLLLHCYPFIREAGILAHVFPHVYMDVGLMPNYLGPSAKRAVAEALEVAPFGKQLFSTDAFGLPELYVGGSLLWRRALASVLEDWLAEDFLQEEDAIRYSTWFASENAQHVYGLSEVGR